MKRLLILFLAFSLLASPLSAFAAIAFVRTSTTVNPASDTVAFDGTATNGYLTVETLVDTSGGASAVTYNGVSMSLLVGPQTTAISSQKAYLWGLANPTTGTNNIVVTKTGTLLVLDAILHSGAQQTTAVEATGTNSGSGTSGSVSVTTVTDNAWLVGYFRGNGSGSFTAGSNTVVRTASGEGTRQLADSGADQTPAGSKSLNVTMTSQAYTAMAFSLKPYVAPIVSTASILSLVKAFWIF